VQLRIIASFCNRIVTVWLKGLESSPVSFETFNLDYGYLYGGRWKGSFQGDQSYLLALRALKRWRMFC
jgi:hypothetical protein